MRVMCAMDIYKISKKKKNFVHENTHEHIFDRL